MPDEITRPESGTAAEAPPTTWHAPPQRRRWLRGLLLILGPLAVLLTGSYIYMHTGRYAETDNAYVKSDTALVGTQIAGQIRKVSVRENQRVAAGDVLFEIDRRPFAIAVERAEAQLEAVEALLVGMQASYRRRLAELNLAHTNVAFTERELERERSLAERQLGSDVDVAEARHEFDLATQQIPVLEQSLAQLRAQLGGAIGGGIKGHSAYRAARSMLDAAELELADTIVRAPIDGIASHVPTVGRYVTPGVAVMSIVAERDPWVEANFKETQLEHVAVGQTVDIRVDTYPGHQWRGRVDSISPATGAEFAVIPAQNASGNWVKVAQRIPVRVTIEAVADSPALRAGMSTIVTIDTGFERPLPRFIGSWWRSSAARASAAEY